MTDFVDSMSEKIASRIIADRGPIWLVWSMSDIGIVSLRAICTKQHYANVYRKAILHHPEIIRVWIEKTITNHLYGESSFEEAIYGNGPIKFRDFDKLKKDKE